MTVRTDDLTTTLDMSIDVAEQSVRAALQAEGFGILTEIDVQATLKEKLDIDRSPYRILGACNPPLANQALNIDPNVGLLLPCNVVLHESKAQTVVSIADPGLMAAASGEPALAYVARAARERLVRVIEAL